MCSLGQAPVPINGSPLGSPPTAPEVGPNGELLPPRQISVVARPPASPGANHVPRQTRHLKCESRISKLRTESFTTLPRPGLG